MLVVMGIIHLVCYAISAIAVHCYIFLGVGEEPNLSRGRRIFAHLVYAIFWIGIFLDNIGF